MAVDDREKAIQTMERVAGAFRVAAEQLKAMPPEPQVHLVLVPEEGAPEHVVCKTDGELARALERIEGQREAVPFLFLGTRVELVKGTRCWRVVNADGTSRALDPDEGFEEAAGAEG